MFLAMIEFLILHHVRDISFQKNQTLPPSDEWTNGIETVG